jgi:crotonobetainyl-CoA:carnitine CoA-transferase CaiB-like acyl-CoA transferase
MPGHAGRRIWREPMKNVDKEFPVANKNLSGVTVLDFSRVLAGPQLTQMLRDLGAEVIKVEQPGSGADERSMSPIVNGQSGFFIMNNRGKKSITLNLKTEKAKGIVLDLARKADIVVENFKPGVMRSLGLTYESFSAVRPDIIMCSISTFGQEGPDSQRAGYDIVAQAMSGLMWMTGDPDRPPQRSGTSIGDVNAATFSLAAILAALYYRERTGKGQYIDMSLRDCLSAVIETAIPRYTMSGGQDKPGRSGVHHAQMAPYGVFYAGREDYIVLGALNDAIWGRLCRAMGHPEMIDDPRFVGAVNRGAHPETKAYIIKTIESWLQGFPTVETPLKILEEASVPAAPVFDIEQLVHDPQFRMRRMMVEVNDPIFGTVELPATPMIFSETTVENSEPPPVLGQHTEEILRELGLDSAAIAALRAEKVICSI